MRNHVERIIIVLCLLCSIVATIMAVRVYFSIIPPEEPEIAGECLAGNDMEEERFRRHTDQMNLFLLNPTKA